MPARRPRRGRSCGTKAMTPLKPVAGSERTISPSRAPSSRSRSSRWLKPIFRLTTPHTSRSCLRSLTICAGLPGKPLVAAQWPLERRSVWNTMPELIASRRNVRVIGRARSSARAVRPGRFDADIDAVITRCPPAAHPRRGWAANASRTSAGQTPRRRPIVASAPC